MNIPADLRYTKDHEWIKVEGNTAIVGITDFAQSELGDVVYIELPPIGKSVKQKDGLAVVESTKAASDVYAPLGGVVVQINEQLAGASEKVNSDPYGAGWMVKLEQVSPNELQGLLTAEQYAQLVKK